jgi:poly-gamma-glutamate synthesis protein (capsule biosynthesis protein)
VVVLAACTGPAPRNEVGLGGPSTDRPSGRPAVPGATVRLLFGGDVMLGRGVAAAGVAEPFEDLRAVVAGADLAAANLESPLTERRHLRAAGPNALEAPPEAASVLADAGFDVMSVANNHAGDAGPETVADTLAAVRTVGLTPVGGGSDAARAFAPRVEQRDGLRVAFLAFDATGRGPRARGEGPGVAWWDEALARRAVLRARREADLVAVSIHGGAEYIPAPDPYLRRLARRLASWGADVVWCHGPHVRQPVGVLDPDGDGRPTVVALSLGNLLFDQWIPGTRRGGLLEVLAGPEGALAFRVGTADIGVGSVGFGRWRPPRGTAAALDGGWWTPVRAVTPVPLARPELPGFEGDVVDAALGDADGDGRLEAVVAFRRPYRPTEVNALAPRATWVDARGWTAHLGVYAPDTLRPRWVAGTLLRPVARVAACDGSLAVAYSSLDDPTIVAAGAWRWGGFGFLPLPDLERPAVPGCADVDADGRLDPVLMDPTVLVAITEGSPP